MIGFEWHPTRHEHPEFPGKDWAFEVNNNDTVLGYHDWVEHKIEAIDGKQRKPRITVRTTVHQTGVPQNEGFVKLYAVKVETTGTSWHELFGSKEAYDAFVQGVKAGAASCNDFDIAVEGPFGG